VVESSLVDPGTGNLIQVTRCLTHASSGAILAERIRWARSAVARARGLIGSSLGPEEALILQPAKQVHTLFMAGPIDVVFCARDWRVLHVVSPMHPWRISRWVGRALYAIELPPGAASRVQIDDLLELVERPVGA
jgi:uncharacterized membrane protein (UPF0127 family)